MAVRFARENDFDSAIAAEVANYPALSVALVKAMIATESEFNPRAFRNEPHIQDASRGLMQILYRTAKGVGYSGTPEGLFDPVVNLTYGIKHLASVIKARGDIWAGVSAYNNGTGKKAIKDTVVCDARDQQTGDCIASHTAKAGEFFNQRYVNKVQKWYQYFSGGTATAGVGGALGLLLLIGLLLSRVRGG